MLNRLLGRRGVMVGVDRPIKLVCLCAAVTFTIGLHAIRVWAADLPDWKPTPASAVAGGTWFWSFSRSVAIVDAFDNRGETLLEVEQTDPKTGGFGRIFLWNPLTDISVEIPLESRFALAQESAFKRISSLGGIRPVVSTIGWKLQEDYVKFGPQCGNNFDQFFELTDLAEKTLRHFYLIRLESAPVMIRATPCREAQDSRTEIVEQRLTTPEVSAAPASDGTVFMWSPTSDDRAFLMRFDKDGHDHLPQDGYLLTIDADAVQNALGGIEDPHKRYETVLMMVQRLIQKH